ncbi:MAG TPA: methylaspartate mutase accessory protein GlmL [Feifaniaceae bacterium]|nr:methylaspartate mutase accessory protein GlmL [Feifaniaceae bacterium]
MTEPVLLIDFGSTYTKLTAVDVGEERLLGTAQSHTTVRTDIGEGLSRALCALESRTGKLEFTARYACSSAAGGLNMCACGLVPALTGKAAKLAALGAGAKVAKTYSYQLTGADIRELERIGPDILLLTGGTDGGDSACILHNARSLAQSALICPIVLAGNRSCAEECAAILSAKRVYMTANVMPRFNELDIKPAQECIRSIFMERIVCAKGLSGAQSLLDGIVMPTPAAAYRALELLSKGCADEPGLGELMAVDLGGATTDVYSMSGGEPRQPNTFVSGLTEPYAKRSVEGDIGMRFNALGILESAGRERIAALCGLAPEEAEARVRALAADPKYLPQSGEDALLDHALASLAVEIAAMRHAGTLESVCTPLGWSYLQTGKDLRDVTKLVLTGGALIRARGVGGIAARALYSEEQPMSLRPVRAEVLLDGQYILSAMGLLSVTHPGAALRILKKELTSYGSVQQEA